MKVLRIVALVFYCLTVANLAFGEGTGARWAVEEPIPGGMYHAQSGEWLSSINARITKAKSLSDSLLGPVELEEYKLYIANNEAQFDSLVQGVFPHWGAAAALPQLHRIVLKSPHLKLTGKTMETLAAHEYSHLLMYALADGKAPRWMDEGLAMYFAQEWSYQDFVNVSWAAIRGTMIPLAEIESLNTFSKARAEVAYAESYLAVNYLFEYYGPEGMKETLSGLKAGLSIDSAMQRAFGLDEAGFEREVFANIRENHTLLGILMGSNLFWGALALIVVIGFIRTRLNRKKRYAQWEEEERYQSTDFDYGDPDNPEKIDDEDEPWKQDD
ncbi:hypothetical protein JYU19_02295 [bacterium AH-315-J21]|nr:hypothetical protein [bacterium AH-315-J21]